jgi:hypothetical protein
MEGVKHLIQCQCILPQYKNQSNPVFHSFVVFSIVDDDGELLPKNAQCNNCGSIHKIVDVCKSEFLGKDDSKSVMTIKDIESNLPQGVIDILKTYECELATWEHIDFCISNQLWGTKVIISREREGDKISGKLLTIGEQRHRIEPYEFTEDF